MKTGLPRHFTVIACPTSICEMSTSVEDSASTSADGLRLLIIGQATAAAPKTAVVLTSKLMKSRRVPESDPPCVVSAIRIIP